MDIDSDDAHDDGDHHYGHVCEIRSDMMNEIKKYKGYHAIKIRTRMGHKTLLLTDHDIARCMDRAVKHDLVYRKIPILRRFYYALLLLIYG